MASLDKSLDDIISSTRGKRFSGKKKIVGKKQVNKTTLKPKTFQKLANKATARASTLLDSSYATKVVVYGLPKDLKQDSIKEFFQSQVGGVSNIACSYNERGQFKGIATIIFNSAKAASRAVEKYNGAPIDNGSNKLKLELIIDPTKKPLSTRITANAKPTKSLTQRIKAVGVPVKKAGAKGGKPPVKGQAVKGQAKGPKPAKKKAPKREKKTVEQLDQEMADYFEN